MDEVSQSETSLSGSVEEEKAPPEVVEKGRDFEEAGEQYSPGEEVISEAVVTTPGSPGASKEDVKSPENKLNEGAEVDEHELEEADKNARNQDLETQETHGSPKEQEDKPEEQQDRSVEQQDRSEEEQCRQGEDEDREAEDTQDGEVEKTQDREVEDTQDREVEDTQDSQEELGMQEKEDRQLKDQEQHRTDEEIGTTEEKEDTLGDEIDKSEENLDEPREEGDNQKEKQKKVQEDQEKLKDDEEQLEEEKEKPEEEIDTQAAKQQSEEASKEMTTEERDDVHHDLKDKPEELNEPKKIASEEKTADSEEMDKDVQSVTLKQNKPSEDPDETVFEEVDANVSDEKQGNADESDMLGDSDMTVPDKEDEKDVLDDAGAAAAADNASPMEVDSLSNDDVEMISEDNETTTTNLKEKEGVSGAESEKSPSNPPEDEPMEDEPEETSNDQVVEGEDVVDTNEDKQTEETIEVPDVSDDEKEDEEPEQTTDKNSADTFEKLRCDEVAEKDDDDANEGGQIATTDDASPGNDEDVVEVEPATNELSEAADTSTNREDDADIENVQEPEESDVCLIPDTETEMTEAEKERAIQARENAEKEGDLAEEQAAVAAAEKEPESVQEEAPQEPEQEPLLEEMLPPEPTTTGGTTPHKTIIFLAVSAENTCAQCKEKKICGYRFKEADKPTTEYLCEITCVDKHLAANPGKYFLRRKKFLVEEVPEADNDVEHECLQCQKKAVKNKYFFKQEDVTFYVCSEDCYKTLSSDEPDKFNLKRDSIRVRNIGHTTISSKGSNSTDSRIVSRSAVEAEAAKVERTTSFLRRCTDCQSQIQILPNSKNLVWQAMDFCDELCLGKYQRRIGSNCQTCKGEVPHQSLGKYCVRFGFEVRQFCCATCLNNFKKGLKTCSCCQKDISGSGEGFLAPVGDKEQFKDFCSQACMRRYDSMCNAKKKLRTDRCGVCNFEKQMRVEMTIDGKEHNFCSNPCFSAFKFVSNIVPDQCGMCSKYFERKSTECFTIYGDKQRPKVFCSRICFNVYIIVNRQITSCQWCKVKKYDFDMIMKIVDQRQIMMCSLNCLTLYGVSLNAFSRASIKCDNCNSCTTPQYHLTMSDASMRNFCTYQCVMQFQSQFARVPLTLDSEAMAAATHHVKQKVAAASAATPAAPFPTGLPKRVKLNLSQAQGVGLGVVTVSTPPSTQNQNIVNNQSHSPVMPVISNVASLAPVQSERLIGQTSLLKRVSTPRGRGRAKKIVTERPPRVPSPPPVPPITRTRSTSSPVLPPTPITPPVAVSNKSTRGGRTSSRSTGTHTPSESPRPPSPVIEKQIETKIVTVPPYPPLVRNVQTSCHPKTDDASVDCRPETAEIGIQTDEDFSSKILIPVPVPIFVPQPMYMYSAPFPVPVPIPLPIPVPIFIPTTRNSSAGILKEIKKIQDKMPADPFEAELLMMAEMVADEKNESDSDSEEDMKPEPRLIQVEYQTPTVATNNVVVNIEPQNNTSFGEDVLQMALKMASGDYEEPGVDLESAMTTNTIAHPPPGMIHPSHVADDPGIPIDHHHVLLDQPQRGGRGRKRGAIAAPVTPRNNRSPIKRQRLSVDSTPPVLPIPIEKPDANMCLKFTFGVNAWKQWVMTKNADIEKSSIRRRLFKTELLQMTADELNYSLCLFVKEVRKPNGTEYAPDTIYYLVLGIQQYLYENGRIDNIFTDPYYERFTDCLDEVARKFSVLYNDSQYIVTRVEEEHLWECKQLGAHSPHVLLSTLMFFNTKHFNLTNVEEHMQLSFSHIMKHWKRSAQNTKSPGTRNVLLRFYPPQAGLDANPRKKKVYEQQENEENPLRCPVRLYEFYLSKCPESVKTRNDVFYLQPERSCVPDSPVWYSTQALGEENLQKMLHRVKMVKEINIALLTS